MVHSATKFIGGHGTSIGGVIVDGGKFDYVASGRFPGFTEPDPSYHGLVFSQLPEPLRPAQYILKARLQLTCATSAPPMSPFNAFLFLQGLETLSSCAWSGTARTPRRSPSGSRPATRSSGSPTRGWRRARGTTAHSSTCRAATARSSRSGSRAASRRASGFIEGLELFSHLANVGDVRSLAIHPATHDAPPARTAEEQVTTGVTPDLVRLSVGIETLDDILADLDAGFRAAKSA